VGRTFEDIAPRRLRSGQRDSESDIFKLFLSSNAIIPMHNSYVAYQRKVAFVSAIFESLPVKQFFSTFSEFKSKSHGLALILPLRMTKRWCLYEQF
jgi:hypothetical protein